MVRSRYCPCDSHGSLPRIIVLALAVISAMGLGQRQVGPGESRMENGVE